MKDIVPDTSQNITREKIKSLLPKGSSVQITDEILSLVHNMGDSVDLPQNLMEEEFMSYMHLVGKLSGIGIKDLISATKYCNLKRHYPNKKAWSIVFPDKYDKLIAEKRQVDSHVSMYNSSRLVQEIDKELLIPAHLQYAPYFHAAVKKQFELMNGTAGKNADGEEMTVSPMVMHLAAKELALITKQPESTTIDIKIGQSDAMLEAQQEMNNSLEQLVANQAAAFAAGKDVSDLQRIHITTVEVDAEVVDDE